ncbi:MAG TPA: metal-dependent hydrolase [Candidatus Polarisedimenticolaceae bacterium]|nr:metal-dependent hydrolase [Candidatus Polarisedimenticolaceae bacterium]
MPTVVTHLMTGAALGVVMAPRLPSRVKLLGAVCAALPDLDVIGFNMGIHYGDLLGHRGLTHSLAFAALAALLVLPLAGEAARGASWRYLFLATASHGLLDAFTDGGYGVAFFSPLSNARYFAPWTPIRVSPIGLERFFERGGLDVLWSEAVWIWLPCGALLLVAAGRRLWRGLSSA